MPSRAAEPSCAHILKVLADETRLAVMQQLLGGPLRVGALNAELRVEPTLLSHHLRVLREAGLVRAERQGCAVLYRLAPRVAARRRRRALDLGCCELRFSA